MKFKRLICFVLLISLTLWIGCANTNDTSDSSNDCKFDVESLKSSKIVRPDNAKQYEIDASLLLKKVIYDTYGVSVDIITDWVKKGEEVGNDSYEFFIGKTNREQSEELYNGFASDFDYGISYDGTKIALAGNNYLSIAYAVKILELNFFKENEISISKDAVYINSMTESEIEYIRNEVSAGKYVGLTDTLTDDDKKHGKYNLVFSEEFDSGKINTDVWNHEYGYIANNELQCYNNRTKNSRLDFGCLVIEAHKESMNGFDYTSARLNTKGKFSFQYGYIEMRAILPEGQGVWPAFWMMGNNGSWPACGEIDIMEMIGGKSREDTVHGTVHWGTSSPYNHMSYGLSTVAQGDLSEEFHTYAVEWDENYIKWYLDGKQFCVIDISGEQFDMFRQEFFIIVNLAIGGDWPGSPDSSTVFPQQYVIDYIRVYQ